MKNKLLKNKTFWLATIAVVLCASVSVPSAMAYFTTYVKAEGGYEITLGDETEIEEDVKDMTKSISIKNTGETDCYVRVKVFCGSELNITYSGAVDDSGNQYWTLDDDGYWYYKDILKVGSSSEVLNAKINLPEDYKDKFNVVVVQECTPVLYKEDGTAYADWNAKVDTKTDIGVADASKEANQ
jgi:hypothetical protein